MELLHNREFKYYDKKTDTIDIVNYIKTVMARNCIEHLYSEYISYTEEFNQALTEIEYLYSKQLNAFVYPPNNFGQYYQGKEQLKEVA